MSRHPGGLGPGEQGKGVVDEQRRCHGHRDQGRRRDPLHTRGHRHCDRMNERCEQSQPRPSTAPAAAPSMIASTTDGLVGAVASVAARPRCPPTRHRGARPTRHVVLGRSSRFLGNRRRRRSQRISIVWRKAACSGEVRAGSSASRASASRRALSTKAAAPDGSRSHRPGRPVWFSP